jgi:lipopolysaccharide/colanic/teichoic acid biosynthesis glycosyltransferase
MSLSKTDAGEIPSGANVAVLHVERRAAAPVEAAVPAPSSTVRVARRALDLLIAGVGVVLAAPVMLVVVLAVRLDSPGPALFRQRRIGRDRREFTVLKFRSMRAAADSAPHRRYVSQLIGRSGGERSEDGGLYKLAVDDRITRVGRILRKTSLDELPQLFNVLRGEMSLVGPRPVIAYEVEQYPQWYHRRFAVRPGLTGLWQVSGRNQRTYEEMVQLDIEYAEHQSLRLDVKILVKTIWVVLSGRGVA